MRKALRRIAFLALLAALVWCGGLLADSVRLRDGIVRFHVVANSDTQEDQDLKLLVRDAVIGSLRQGLQDVTDVEKAKAYLSEYLPEIEGLANRTLQAAGSDQTAVVSLDQEAFPTRVYDTFSLPAGVYEALRIVIGEGQGHNWWCVVFPELCLPATADGFQEAAAVSGFPDSLADTLAGEEDYEIRFFLLDCLGKMENFFHQLS